MTIIESFHQRLRVESAVFVADAAALGPEVAMKALRGGIDVLQARLAQLGVPAAPFRPTREEVVVERVLVAAAAKRPGPPLETPAQVVGALHVVDSVIAAQIGTTVALLHVSRTREVRITRPRQIAAYFAHALTQASLSQIARHYGWKDHTTVCYARDVIPDLFARKLLPYDVTRIEHALRDALTSAGYYCSKARLAAA